MVIWSNGLMVESASFDHATIPTMLPLWYNVVEVRTLSIKIRAHYDGTTFVPDEPADLKVGEPVQVESTATEPEEVAADFERRRAALRRIAAEAVHGVNIPLEALRRENMYEDRP